MDDLFIRNYIEDLLKNVRTQVLLKLIKPYTRIRIPFISKVKTNLIAGQGNSLSLCQSLSLYHFGLVWFVFTSWKEFKRIG